MLNHATLLYVYLNLRIPYTLPMAYLTYGIPYLWSTLPIVYLTYGKRDQIGRFIVLWGTF